MIRAGCSQSTQKNAKTGDRRRKEMIVSISYRNENPDVNVSIKLVKKFGYFSPDLHC